MSLKKDLVASDKKICVIGCGYIGISTMAYFAREGINCVGYDVDSSKVNSINNGINPISELEQWLGFSIKPLVQSGLICAVDKFELLNPETISVIMIAVPTEKGAVPWFDALEDVVQKIVDNRMKDHLVIVESTLAPGTTDKILRPKLNNVVVAPRRDWFGDKSKTLKSLSRIVGGMNKQSTEDTIEVLSLVCDTLYQCDYTEAEMVKAVENAIRHVDITFTNELALAFPHINIKKVMQLASTKWNIERYTPSAGCGGYCIPLAPRYLIDASPSSDLLTIMAAAIHTDDHMPMVIANQMMKCDNVGILGLCYKGDLKVDILSPTKKIVEYLKEFTGVKVNDTLYTPEEIQKITGVESFQFPEDLNQFDGIILMSDHNQYRSIHPMKLISYLNNCKMILNNTGLWANIDFKYSGIQHKYIGGAGWMD